MLSPIRPRAMGTGVTLTEELIDAVLSVTEAAVIITDPPEGTVAGAV